MRRGGEVRKSADRVGRRAMRLREPGSLRALRPASPFARREAASAWRGAGAGRIAWRLNKKTAADRIAVCSM